MKILMRAKLSGLRNGAAWPKIGEVAEVDDAEGAELCAAGIATPVAEVDAGVETAVVGDDSEKRDAGLTTKNAPVKKTAAKAAPAEKPADDAKPADDKGTVEL